MADGSVRRFGRDLRDDQTDILQPDLIDDHDPLLAASRRGKMRPIMGAELGDGHHVFHHAAVLGAVNALRWRFDRAFRAAFGH
jgi:hypothetical protein